jgi:hypothetical protein
MATRRKKEVLSTDNSKAVEALQSDEFSRMKDAEALNVALALQEIIRGNTSILANQDTMGEELHRLRERMDKYDQATAKYEANRESFVEEVLQRSEKLRATGSGKDKLIARGTLQLQEAITNARAKNASDKLRFEEALQTMEKVKIISPGVWETGYVSGGQPVQHLVSEVIKIKHKTWVLPVGVEIEVPKVVAEVLANRRRSDQETAERQAVLSKIMNNDQLVAETARINKKYNTNSTLPYQE